MYEVRKITLKNNQHEVTRLIPDFDNQEMAIVSEFFMSDLALLGEDLIMAFDEVLSGFTDEIQLSGNRCAITIKEDYSKIEDLLDELFSDTEVLASYEMETEALLELILQWKEDLDAFELE